MDLILELPLRPLIEKPEEQDQKQGLKVTWCYTCYIQIGHVSTSVDLKSLAYIWSYNDWAC